MPSGDIRTLDALDVVNAEMAEEARTRTSPFETSTERGIARCAAEPEHCPVRSPKYQDLTHDGQDELIVGVEETRHRLVVWAFMVQGGVVHRILETVGMSLSVEVVEGDPVIRQSTGYPGYDRRTVYSWDPEEQTMNIRKIELDRPLSSSPGRTP
ncbi:hypothetical protein [Streptomyces sp. NPDC048650]|uniref:hypothetical protein n=1 Tax=Streptomyces sp. NPDC048650 TaxID=3365583 RepID=UPI00371E343C